MSCCRSKLDCGVEFGTYERKKALKRVNLFGLRTGTAQLALKTEVSMMIQYNWTETKTKTIFRAAQAGGRHHLGSESHLCVTLT